MYEVRGFIFKEVNGEVQKFPFGNMTTSGYKEVHEVMKTMDIPHYMFILKEVKE